MCPIESVKIMKNPNRIVLSRVAVTMVLILSLPLFFLGIVILPQGLHYYNLVLMAISTLAIVHTGYEFSKWSSQESKIKNNAVVRKNVIVNVTVMEMKTVVVQLLVLLVVVNLDK